MVGVRGLVVDGQRAVQRFVSSLAQHEIGRVARTACPRCITVQRTLAAFVSAKTPTSLHLAVPLSKAETASGSAETTWHLASSCDSSRPLS